MKIRNWSETDTDRLEVDTLVARRTRPSARRRHAGSEWQRATGTPKPGKGEKCRCTRTTRCC